MDIDHGMDEHSEFVPTLPSQLTSNWHTHDADPDLVKWQGSQTSSLALNALMKEAAKPARRSPRNQRAQAGSNSSAPSGSLSLSLSGSSSTASRSTHRMPRSRTRHASQLASTSSLTSTPASSITSDPTQFLQTLKGVSEKVRVNESARAKKRLFTGEVKEQRSGPDAVGIKTCHGKEKENLRRSTTGVKENDKIRGSVIGHRSLPNMGGLKEEMNVDNGSFQMDLDSTMDVEHSASRLYPQDDVVVIASSSISGPPA